MSIEITEEQREFLTVFVLPELADSVEREIPFLESQGDGETVESRKATLQKIKDLNNHLKGYYWSVDQEGQPKEPAKPLPIGAVTIKARAEAIAQRAKDQYHKDGEIEIDDKPAVLSEGQDNGVYVQAWVWVNFEGTEFDKLSQPKMSPLEAATKLSLGKTIDRKDMPSFDRVLIELELIKTDCSRALLQLKKAAKDGKGLQGPSIKAIKASRAM